MRTTKEGLAVLVPTLVTCGGTIGPMYRAAKILGEARGNAAMAELLPLKAFPTLEALSLTADTLTPETVVAFFGSKSHHDKIMLEGTTVAREIRGMSFQAFAHTLLPVRDGYYRNREIQVPVRNLVPLGPQKGNLVAHLAGVFASGCSDDFIQNLLDEQYLFLKKAQGFNLLDYEMTPNLVAETKKAKALLGL